MGGPIPGLMVLGAVRKQAEEWGHPQWAEETFRAKPGNSILPRPLLWFLSSYPSVKLTLSPIAFGYAM